MAASSADLITRVTTSSRPVATTLTAGKAGGVLSISCAALTGWPTATGVHFQLYKVNTSGVKIEGSQTDWEGVVSGTSIGSMVLKAGTDSGYAIGDTVEAMPTAAWADGLAQGLLVGLNPDGTHKVFTESAIVPTATLQDSSVTSPKVATGMVVQTVATDFSAVATGTTVIPYDDTIPQITEGDQFMTQAITPKSATNRLFIEAKMYLAISSNGQRIGALFQDSTANALAAQSMYVGNFADPITVYITHDMVAGTTSSTTFKVRGGSETAGTWTFNGTGGARKFGGVTLSSIKITEYKA